MEQSNSKNQILNALKWIFAISFIIAGISTVFRGAFIGGLLITLSGALLIPKISEILKEKFSFWQKRTTRIVSTIAILLVGAGISGSKLDKRIKNEKSKVEETAIETLRVPNYEILKEVVVRYDKASSYFVLIDKVDVSNDKFIDSVKLIVDKIVRQKEAKINIEILDNKEALEVMFNSHYGTNSLGRALNKSELKLLERHHIASFSGELETMPNLNTLDIFPSAQKSNTELGKYRNSFEYNPNSEKNTISTSTNVTSSETDEVDNSDFWNEFDPIVKERVHKMIKEKDCAGLQSEFNITADNMDKLQSTGKSGSRNLELMAFLEDKIKELDCR